jgi:hypothetical protein
MKLWIVYILGVFMLGVLLWRKPASMRAWIVAGLVAFVCFAYYFLNQI